MSNVSLSVILTFQWFSSCRTHRLLDEEEFFLMKLKLIEVKENKKN